MSTNVNRGRITVNGVQRLRRYHYYWCRQCQRSIRTTTTNPDEVLCTHCLGQVRYELDMSRPRFRVETQMEPSSAARLLDSLAQMLDPPPRQAQNLEDGSLARHRAFVLLQFTDHDQLPRPVPPHENMNSNEQLGQNDTPPRAPNSASEALPVVTLTADHLAIDPICPICKDEFKVGNEVRQLACKHFYHSECILPWLQMHNTCPVCRFELQGLSNGNVNNIFEENYYSGSGDEMGRNEDYWRWTRFSLRRPLGMVLNWVNLWLDFLDNAISSAFHEGDNFLRHSRFLP